MNTKLPAIAIALMLSSACASAASLAGADASLQATLLPTVSVTARASHPDAEPTMRVAPGAPVGVTLLPTVRVVAAQLERPQATFAQQEDPGRQLLVDGLGAVPYAIAFRNLLPQ